MMYYRLAKYADDCVPQIHAMGAKATHVVGIQCMESIRDRCTIASELESDRILSYQLVIHSRALSSKQCLNVVLVNDAAARSGFKPAVWWSGKQIQLC